MHDRQTTGRACTVYGVRVYGAVYGVYGCGRPYVLRKT